MSIYRNNVQHSLITALGAVYPVVKRLIGEGCFSAAAIAWVRKNPPHHAALIFYGASFIDHIAGYPACRQIRYLRDMATLEWYCHLARHAADAEPLDPSALTALPLNRLGTLRLTPHPSLRLLESPWPVEDIQMEHRKKDIGVIELNGTGNHHILIWRDGLSVRVIALTRPCYRLLDALAQGQSVDDAWQQTSAHADAEALAGMLGYLLGLRLFVDFTVQEGQ